MSLFGTRKPVLVFGGGYSPEDHDQAGERSGEDQVGRAVFMVDAMTGELIWSASNEGSKRCPDMESPWAGQQE